MKKISLKLNKIAVPILMSIFFCLSSCSKKNNIDNDDDSGSEFVPPNGFSYNADKPFEGTPFILPNGVTIEKATGYTAIYPENQCNGLKYDQMASEGLLVATCLIFKNTTGKPVNIEFPPGVIYESESSNTQHGILVQRASIEVPAQPVFYKLLGGACLNNSKQPGSYLANFKINKITTWKPMLDFFKELEKKNLRPNGVMDYDINAKIQNIVWGIAAKGKIDSFNQQLLNEIPNK